MLVLTRSKGEVIHIGDDITVTVLKVDASRDQVRLGIEAPKGIVILRQEVKDKLDLEKTANAD